MKRRCVSEAIRWKLLSIGQFCLEQSNRKQLIPIEQGLNISLPQFRAHLSEAKVTGVWIENVEDNVWSISYLSEPLIQFA